MNESQVRFEFAVIGAGWEDYRLFVDDKEIYLISTCIYADYDLNKLLEALCCFSTDYNRYDNTHTDYAYTDLCKGILVEPEDSQSRFMIEIEAPGETHSPEYYSQFYDEIPESVNIWWDAEANGFRWNIKRSLERGNGFMLDVTLESHYAGGEENTDSFQISYKSFCKAIADGCTEAIKKNGFGGLARSNWGHDIDIRKLLFIKAIAYDMLEDIMVGLPDDNEDVYFSDISKELELLML